MASLQSKNTAQSSKLLKYVQQKWHKTLVTPPKKIPNSKIRPEHGDKNHSSRGCYRIKPDFQETTDGLPAGRSR